ncbi:MAG: hypothetical protein COS92_01365 [Desulfobacterales bacterium CG07_land_8_20_14_0_80_52_14]|nr:MAG: hypothetical protein COX20_11525 [Desulfobacterales bacterium CG23_combo_of_CG06-09_8_20_14_all_52_9]PIU50442.1 MAG: hypothetical protein COS92_01365 [Desulfobacterales bacterium CG07_land_8_20_14_0_80_52_14]
MNAKTLIIGGGACSRNMAKELMQSGISVVVAGFKSTDAALLSIQSSPDAGDLLEIMDESQIRSCTGSAGQFTVEWVAAGRRIRREVQHIIVAEDTVRHVNGSLYGLKEGPRVVSISGFKSLMRSSSEKPFLTESASRVAFLTGLFHESLPLMAEEMMQAAMDLQRDAGVQAYVFTGNLKVAGDGLETLSRKAKETGVIFVKFTNTPPEITQAEDGSVTLTYPDEIIRQKCILRPDFTVLDETILPSPNLSAIAAILQLEAGPDGFTQADNVHRLPTSTNRKGIWAVGPARGVSSPSLMGSEIAHTALSIAFPEEIGSDTERKARIEIEQCVRCLTCFRICPYRAVELSPRPVISAAACEGCGICVAECPRDAIVLPISPSDGKVLKPMSAPKDSTESLRPSAFVVDVTVFCCSRSAVPARNMALAMGFELPGNLTFIEVPCAGAVSQSHLLEALRRGADGVLVIGCHGDNCHSSSGTLLAQGRLNSIRERMPALGVPMKRLAFRSLASNMGVEFSQIVNRFIGKLEPVGQNPLKIKDGGLKETEQRRR